MWVYPLYAAASQASTVVKIVSLLMDGLALQVKGDLVGKPLEVMQERECFVAADPDPVGSSDALLIFKNKLTRDLRSSSAILFGSRLVLEMSTSE